MNLADEFVSTRNRVTIHFQDHVPRRQPSIFRRASRANALNRRAIHLVRNIELLPDVRSDRRNRQTQFALLRRTAAAFVVSNFRLGMELTNLNRQRLLFAIAQNAQLDRISRRNLADSNLQHAAVDDLLAVDIAKHVAALQTGSAGRASQA